MVISLGKVKRISTGEPSLTSLERKKYTPRELTSRDSVLVSPTAAPVVQRTVSGSRIWKRWVVRRSEPVKAYLLIDERVYPGAVQGTIGLRVQNRFNSGRYACTRTFAEIGRGMGSGELAKTESRQIVRWRGLIAELEY